MGAIKLYVDNGSSFEEIDYNFFTIAVGWQKNKATRDFGANRFIIKTPITTPFIKREGSKFFVVESESPCQYFAAHNWDYSVDTYRGEIAYYGYTYPYNDYTDVSGFIKYERGGHSVSQIEYTPQSREFDLSEIADLGFDYKFEYGVNHIYDTENKGAPPLDMKIIMVEPSIPYGEFEAELGDTIKINDDLYNSGEGWFEQGNLGEKRIIANRTTYRVEYTITNNRPRRVKARAASTNGYTLKWYDNDYAPAAP